MRPLLGFFVLSALSSCKVVTNLMLPYTQKIVRSEALCDTLYQVPVIITDRILHSETDGTYKLTFSDFPQGADLIRNATSKYIANNVANHFINGSLKLSARQLDTLSSRIGKMSDEFEVRKYKHYRLNVDSIFAGHHGVVLFFKVNWNEKDYRLWRSEDYQAGYTTVHVARILVSGMLCVFSCDSGEIFHYMPFLKSSLYTSTGTVEGGVPLGKFNVSLDRWLEPAFRELVQRNKCIK